MIVSHFYQRQHRYNGGASCQHPRVIVGFTYNRLEFYVQPLSKRNLPLCLVSSILILTSRISVYIYIYRTGYYNMKIDKKLVDVCIIKEIVAAYLLCWCFFLSVIYSWSSEFDKYLQSIHI